ncbi:HRDC domain-containing protein [Gorillibacterium sp. sgz5001074]|uniref:HRDC domain-containing protein n=1 Tax=Gorillibacterium sp. sgz5001074 TaxID=3446695 RepID=UPI003F679898
MQLIFLSTMERKTGEDRVRTAQVSITEHQGAWRVLWSEEGTDGKPAQDIWYEGDGWKDLLHGFREGLKVKKSQGYFPLIDTSLPGGGETAKNRDMLMLQYYGEMHYADAVFQELRVWRRKTANKEGKSAFFVATNRMLFMLAAYLPRTVEELQQIPGFGQRKAEIYGPEVFAITGKGERQTDFPLDWVKAEVAEADFDAWLLELQRSREQQEQEKLMRRKRVLEGAAAGCSLADLEASTGLKRPDLIRLVEELDRNGYDMSPLIGVELEQEDDAHTARVRELFCSLGIRFLKPVLQALYTEEELKQADMNGCYEKLRLHRIRYKHSLESEQPAASEPQAAV